MIIALLGLGCPSFAQAAAAQAGEGHGEGTHASHTSHPHHLGFFLGGATRGDEGEFDHTGMTFGLDYEYRFAPEWGVGAVIEGVAFSEDHRDLAFAVPLFWHPVDSLSLGIGPGFETDGSHAAFLLRVSISYAIHFRKLTIAPTLAFDMTNGPNTLVYGLSIGRGF